VVVGPGGGRATRPRAPAVRDAAASRPARGVARGMRRAPYPPSVYPVIADGKHLPTRHAGCWF